MKQVAEGIFLLKLPMDGFPPGHINVYLIKGDNGHLLIDTGWDTKNALLSLNKQLEELGVGVKDISRILLTHSHTDHAGMSARLKKYSGANVYMHEKESEVVKSRYLNPEKTGKDVFFEVTDKLLRLHGMPEPDMVRPETPLPKVSGPPFPDHTLKDGDVISQGSTSLKVLWTPGHSPGHICLYEPEQKILFSGDLVLPDTVSNVGLHMHQSVNPLQDYLNSLQRVDSLDVRLVFPAHEEVFTDLHKRAEQIYYHHRQKSTEIFEALAGGKAMNAYEISYTMSIVPNTQWPSWHKLSLWDKRFIMFETIAHLESLALDKKIEKFSNNGSPVVYRS